ncbi:MAG: GTP-binding protein [Desulfitobacterium sp.]|nr:GTP-binding protein [Desulfitobacterium sp.]
MMNYNLEKDKLLHIIESVERASWSKKLQQSLVSEISSLKNTIEHDFFTVVILGEFKRGKSTFINALLGSDLLPTNVTPTTATINALMFNEEKIAEVVYKDGHTQKGEATLEFLNGFSADSSFETENINYIKIGYPSELLRNHVILVDTPGVSDMNQQRVQVTYDFIPRADVVIFLLDATSPLKRTEKEFIEDHLLKYGIEKVIFIANRFDEIEEEDEEEVLEDIKKRLSTSFKKMGEEGIHLIPFSAYQALQGVINKDESLINASNLPIVKETIETLIYDGTSPENKIRTYTRKLRFGLEALYRQIQQELSIASANAEELEKIIAQMNILISEQASRKNKLKDYAEIQKSDMLAIIRKSLQNFQRELKEEVFELVDSYKGTEFKHYIEKQIVSLVQKRISQWITTYSGPMNLMLSKLNQELANALARHFNTTIALHGNAHVSTEFKGTPVKLAIQAEDISNVTMKAGLIAGGAAGLLILVGGPLLLPLVGLAGMPYLQKTLLDNKLKEAKAKVLPELNNLMNKTFNTLYEEIEKNMSISVEQIVILNEQRFAEIFSAYKEEIEQNIKAKKSNQDSFLEEEKDLVSKKALLEKLLQELKRG